LSWRIRACPRPPSALLGPIDLGSIIVVIRPIVVVMIIRPIVMMIVVAVIIWPIVVMIIMMIIMMIIWPIIAVIVIMAVVVPIIIIDLLDAAGRDGRFERNRREREG
jgi:hypothetical protein